MSSSSDGDMVAVDELPSMPKALKRESDDEKPSTSKASGGNREASGGNRKTSGGNRKASGGQSHSANKEGGAFKTKKITELVHNYLPKSDHLHNIEYHKRKKEMGKRYRADREVVHDKIFKAFECKNAYTTKELLQMTKQPRPYLMEILKEICTSTVHYRIGTVWQLKKEYIHVTPEGTPKVKGFEPKGKGDKGGKGDEISDDTDDTDYTDYSVDEDWVDYNPDEDERGDEDEDSVESD